MKDTIKTIALAVTTTVAVVSLAVNFTAPRYDDEAIALEHAEKVELQYSVENLVNIVCDNESEVWRPMCETREWGLVVDEVYAEEGIILQDYEIQSN